METYGIAAFRSRQSVLRFEELLRAGGIHTQIVSTPRAIAMGCGLSVRFDRRAMQSAMDLYRRHPMENLIGFYVAAQSEGKIDIRALRV